jgi:enamine deaminase RidA (YjgF/YER057c/UK114 family)
MAGADLDVEPRPLVDPYAALGALGLALPDPRPPVANFLPAVIEGALVFLSGQGPVGPEGIVYQGKLGSGVSIEDGYAAARLTTLNLLAACERS